MPDLGQLAAVVVLFAAGLVVGWRWQRARAKRARPEPTIHSQIAELRTVGELSVFRAVSKDILTQVDHSFGDFGRKYLSWAFTKKKLAMVFEFEMDFRYDLRSEMMQVESVDDGEGGRRAIVHLPPCRVEVSIKDMSFYDEQRARFLPWLLPDLVQGFFDGRFSEEDKNRLIASAKGHALSQAQLLAVRYRAQVEHSAYSTLRLLARPLGFNGLELRFREQAEVSGDVALGPAAQPAVLPAGP
jgi:hypothetical protein